MRKFINSIGCKVLVFLLMVSMLLAGSRDRAVMADTAAYNGKTYKKLTKWTKMNEAKLSKLSDGYYPLILAFQSPYENMYYITADNDGRGHDDCWVWNHEELSLFTTTTSARYFKFSGLAKNYRLAGNETAASDDMKAVDEFPINKLFHYKHYAIDEVRIGDEEFFTTVDIEPWCIGIGVEGAPNDGKSCQLYTQTNYPQTKNKFHKVACHDGTDSVLTRDEFIDGNDYWSFEWYNDDVAIYHRDDTFNDDDKMGWKSDGSMFCESCGRVMDSIPRFEVYVGEEYSVSELSTDKVEPGQLLNINDMDKEGRKGVTVIKEGKSLVVAPGGTVIIKGTVWCNGSIENYGTVILDSNARLYSVNRVHDGNCMINNYGQQAFSGVNADKVKAYSEAAWKAVHDTNSIPSYLTQYQSSKDMEGNLIVMKGAVIGQNERSHRLTLFGGAQLINKGSMYLYNGILASDSTIQNEGTISFGFGQRMTSDVTSFVAKTYEPGDKLGGVWIYNDSSLNIANPKAYKETYKSDSAFGRMLAGIKQYNHDAVFCEMINSKSTTFLLKDSLNLYHFKNYTQGNKDSIVFEKIK